METTVKLEQLLVIHLHLLVRKKSDAWFAHKFHNMSLRHSFLRSKAVGYSKKYYVLNLEVRTA